MVLGTCTCICMQQSVTYTTQSLQQVNFSGNFLPRPLFTLIFALVMIYNSKGFSNVRLTYKLDKVVVQLGCAISSPSLTTLRLLFSGADQGIDETAHVPVLLYAQVFSISRISSSLQIFFGTFKISNHTCQSLCRVWIGSAHMLNVI